MRWLCQKFEIFKEHQSKKTLTQFFPALYEEYFALWPPVPTPEDLEAVKGDEACAITKVREYEQEVRYFEFTEVIFVLIKMVTSGCVAGCTTGPERKAVRTGGAHLPA